MVKKKFVFFEEIDAGYSIGHNGIKGHVQMVQKEKGATLRLFIENLKPNDYLIYIVNQENSIIHVINDTSQSKYQKTIELNSSLDSIAGIIISPYESPNKIAVCAWIKEEEQYDIMQLRSSISNYYNRNTNYSSSIPKEDNNVKKIIIDEKNNDIEKKDSHNESEIKSNQVIEEEIMDKEQLNNTQENGENKLHIKNERSTNGGIYNNQIYYLWKNIDELDIILDQVEPFHEKIPHHKWWQINEGNTEIQYYCILYNGYLMPMVYPFMNYKNILQDEKDWIFGIVTEKNNENEIYKYFVYGIPGRFYMQEQPFKGSTGYLYWQSKNMEENELVGYWLLYVDVHTGKIVIPRRPVKPPLNKNIVHNDI